MLPLQLLGRFLMLPLHLLQLLGRLLMPFVLGSSRLGLIIFKVRLDRLNLRLDAEVVLVVFDIDFVYRVCDRLGLRVFSFSDILN